MCCKRYGDIQFKNLRDGSDENIYSYQDDYEEMAENFGEMMKIDLSISLLNLMQTK